MKSDLMQQQIDLFASPPAEPRLSHVERMWAVSFSDEVRKKIIAVFEAPQGVWLDRGAFRPIIDEYKISAWFGHVLGRLHREGLILRQDRYYGSRHPGDGNYIGFGSRFASLGTEGPLELVGVANGR